MRQSRWWGAGHPTPASPAGMDHGGVQLPGMMSEADLRQLRLTGSTDFDLLFLDMMAAHHQGAIDMATTEFRDSALPEVKQLGPANRRQPAGRDRPVPVVAAVGDGIDPVTASWEGTPPSVSCSTLPTTRQDAPSSTLPTTPPGRAFLW
jgi:hypothetical protein